MNYWTRSGAFVIHVMARNAATGLRPLIPLLHVDRLHEARALFMRSRETWRSALTDQEIGFEMAVADADGVPALWLCDEGHFGSEVTEHGRAALRRMRAAKPRAKTKSTTKTEGGPTS